MNPEETRILKAAKKVGCNIHYGRPMFDHQVAIKQNYSGIILIYNNALYIKYLTKILIYDLKNGWSK